MVLKPTVLADMAKHVMVPKFAEGNLTPIRVREQILEGVEGLAERAERLPHLSPLFTSGIPAVLDRAPKRAPNVGSGRVPTLVLGCHVVL
jgi:hypothetical protein